MEIELSSVTTFDNSSGEEFIIDHFSTKTSKATQKKSKKTSITTKIKNSVKSTSNSKLVNEFELPSHFTAELEDPDIKGAFKDDILVQCEDPVDYFKILLDSDIMESIRLETSEYLYGKTGLNTVTINDIYKLIGMLFVLDLYPFHNIEKAFSKRKSMYKSEYVNNNYTIEEFRLLHNNLKLPDRDPMMLFRMIEQSSAKVCTPSNYISLDEMLRKFMGKFKFKHRITSKPAKEGIKFFILCCSSLKVPMAFTFHDNKLEKTIELTQTANMVVKMVNTMVQNHDYDISKLILYMDNYFNSHALFKYFITKGVRCIGTFKTNMIPKEVRAAAADFLRTTKKREVIDNVVHCPIKAFHCEGVYYVFIVDNGPFCIGTNCLDLVNKGN